MRRSLPILFFVCCFGVAAYAEPLKHPQECERLLQTKFRSWKLATVAPEIIKYFERERPHESPDLIKGDWNGDKKIDYAVMLEARSNAETRKTLVLMRAGTTYKTYVLPAWDCLGVMKRGERAYDHETKENFRYKNDA